MNGKTILSIPIVREERTDVIYAKSLITGFEPRSQEMEVAVKISRFLLDHAEELGAIRTADGALAFPPEPGMALPLRRKS